MSDRRPSRIRKPVNYSGFEDTSDDDFANNTPPPSKKPKAEVRDTKSKISKSSPKAGQKESLSSSNISTPILDSGKKRRLPVSEKIYERELKEALQISLYETGGSQDVVVHIEDCGSSSSTQEENLKASNCDDVQEAFAPRKKLSEQEPEKKTRTRLKHDSGTTTFTGIVGTVMDDSIEVLGSLVDNDNSRLHSIAQVTPATRRSQKKKQKSDDESEEDSSDLDLDHESEDDENSSRDVSSVEKDSDFDDKPKKKRQATKKTKSSPQKSLKPKNKSKSLLEASNNVAAKQPKADLKDNTTASSISTVQLSSETVKRNSAKSPGTPITSVRASPITPPSWKPPSRANSGGSSLTTVKSPTTGLRLGLSRNQMTKPLHKSFKVSM